MNNAQTAHPHSHSVPLATAQRFGESLRSVAYDLELPPRTAWVIVDAVWIARSLHEPVDTALIMARVESSSARCLALFYALVLDTWTIAEAEHHAILLAIDPEFDAEGANE